MNCKRIELIADISICDSCIQEIYTCVDKLGIVDITLILKLTYPNNSYLKLIFKDVIEYYYQWSNNYIFYNVSSCKLMKNNNKYYYSFDPDDSIYNISENDNNIIISNIFEIYHSPDRLFSNSKRIELEEFPAEMD